MKETTEHYIDKDSDYLKREINSFQKLWRGGFCRSNRLGGWEGSVAEQREWEYSDLNKISEICIKPFINENTNCLDIGTDGGVWMTQMVAANSITGLECRPAEATNFWSNVNKWLGEQRGYDTNKVKYVLDQDFSCDGLEEQSINYVFSYDVFCHISYSGTRKYLKNLFPKLQEGTNLFIMIADPDKYQNARMRASQTQSKHRPAGPYESWEECVNDWDGEPHPGRWYFYGTERFCEAAEEFGYVIKDEDIIGAYDKNSPIIHFTKE